MSYEIYETDLFEKEFNKIIPKNLQFYFKKQINKLKINPLNKGKPLGTKFIRELKIKKFRLYFHVYESEIVVLLFSVSDKKTQKSVIKQLKSSRIRAKKLVKITKFNKNI